MSRSGGSEAPAVGSLDLENLLKDPYIGERQPRSVLCMPLVCRVKLIGIQYNVATGVFGEERAGLPLMALAVSDGG